MADGQAQTAEIRDSVEEFRVPLGMLKDLVAVTTRAEILDWMSRWSSHLLDARHSVIALADDTDALHVTSFFGPQIMAKTVVAKAEGSYLDAAYRNRKTLVLEDIANSNHWMRDKFIASGIKTLVVTPIIAQGNCFGVFGVGLGPEFKDRNHIIPFLETLAQCLANQLLIIAQVAQLDRLARIDPLTDSYNRRHFSECASGIWTAWQQTGIQFAIVMVDLDYFKEVNDRFGHEAGDTVLQIVSARIKEGIRPNDVLIRMGGEEFCVLIANATLAIARSISHRIWQAVRQNPVTTPTKNIPVSASIGYALVEPTDISYQEVLQRADQGLYQAKSMGRDQVCTINPDAEY